MKINKLTPGHNLLWESSRMMLPEHKEAILQHNKEQQKRRKPILDEQQIEQFMNMIHQSHIMQTELTFHLFNLYKDVLVKGIVKKINLQAQSVTVQEITEGITTIYFTTIIDIDGAAY